MHLEERQQLATEYTSLANMLEALQASADKQREILHEREATIDRLQRDQRMAEVLRNKLFVFYI